MTNQTDSTNTSQPNEGSWTARLTELIRAYPVSSSALAVIAASLVMLGIVATLPSDDAGEPDERVASPTASATPVPALVIRPAGTEVSRLAPIILEFAEPPASDDPARFVSLTPAIGGSYAWSDDRRILLFQPDFPGLDRGVEYTVQVDAAGAGLRESVTWAFTVEGKLAVQHIIPAEGDQEVPVEAPILVQFSRAVVALTVIDELGTRPVLAFVPAVSGQGEWLSTSLYRFQPDSLLPSTDYEVTVRADLSDEPDGVLDQPVTWEFSTISPAISSVSPGNNTMFAPRDQTVTVVFNQPMDRDSVERGFSLRRTEDGAVVGSFEWDETGTRVTFTPGAALVIDSQYRMELRPGLDSVGDGSTSRGREAMFQTAPRATVVRTSPREGEERASRWGVDIEFAAPVDLESIAEHISISGINDEDLRFDSWDGTTVYTSVRLQPSRDYTVTLSEGGVDRQGLPVPGYEFSFRTGELSPRVSFASSSRYGTYAASSEPQLYFFATNYEEVTFDLFEVSEATAMVRIDQPYSDPRYPAGDAIRTWTVAIEGDLNIPLLQATSLSDGGPLPVGHYVVRARLANNNGPHLWFSVVDTVLVTKLAQGELLVWALDYATGEPLEGIELQVFGPRPLAALSEGASIVTGPDGLASVEVVTSSEAQETRSNRRYRVSVDGGGRFGVTSTEWQQGSEPWLLNIPQDYWARDYAGHLYTDRPIYRPGETVNLKGVIRLDDDANYRVPDEAPKGLVLILRDSRYDEVERVTPELNEFGSFAWEFALPESADTGFYRLELLYRIGQNQQSLAYSTFTVAEFRVPEFRVQVTPAETDVIDGDQIDADALATFFFGGAVADAEVRWAALSNPGFIRSEQFPGYSFSNRDYYGRSIVDEPLRGEGSTVTGSNGVATVSLPAVLRGDEGTQRYDISISVSDESAQVVAANASVTVHPASLYAGVKPEGYVATAGEPATINIATIDVLGNALPDRDVVLKVYERVWVTTKERTEGGGRLYRSEPVDTLVATIPARTGSDAHTIVEYVPARAGTLKFVVETTDELGRVARANRFMWVTGSGYVRWRVRNDDVFELIADREQYEPGDVAEVLVPTSYPGSIALVTIERGHIISRETRIITSASEALSIPIVDRHVPNVFVSVVIYRPPTDADPVPRYQVGYVELPVSTDSRKLVVNVTPAEGRARPGDTIRYEVHVTDLDGVGREAELSIAVVDEAVLSLADEVGPDGLRAFWFERGLGVRTGSSLSVSVDRTNDVISEPEEGGKGGGSDSDALRSEFRNTAFWSAQVKTDANGRATIDVPLPDNLTTWRTSVRAISGDTMVGDGIVELLVTKPMLARPALPRFLRVGDQFSIRVLVRNGTEQSQDITVALDVDGLEVGDAVDQTRSVAAGESLAFVWPASATIEGEAQVRFTAVGAGYTDAVEITLPVLLDTTPEATATGGVVIDQSQIEAVYLPDYALTDDGRLEVDVQASLTGVLSRELYHFAIPLDCGRRCELPDRIASRVVATVSVLAAQEGSPSIITRGDIGELIFRQRSDGGWSWCTGTCPSDPAVTAWVLIALAEARDAGLDVDSGVFGSANLFLSRELRRATDVEADDDASWRAMMQYALTRAGWYSTSSSLRALFEQERDQLHNWGRAYLLLALIEADEEANHEAIRALINDLSVDAISSANGSHWEDPPANDYMQNDLVTATLVLRALVAAEPEHPLIEETVRWLVVARSAERWKQLHERAQALDALGAYAELTGELLGDYDYLVELDGQEILSGEFRPIAGRNTDEVDVSLDLLTLGGFSRLSFDRDTAAPGRLYYALNLRYRTPAKDVESLSRGITVAREYTLLDAPGEPISSAPLGEVVRIRLTVMSDSDRKFVTVEDALPAGLEPIDPTLKTVPLDLIEQLEGERVAAVTENAPSYAAPWFAWYLNPWRQVQVRDERLQLFAYRLPRGVHEYVFFARATTPGDFFVAPAVAQEEFFPEVFGRSDSSNFIVEP
jgi:alpha-2-macroglobulin